MPRQIKQEKARHGMPDLVLGENFKKLLDWKLNACLFHF
jgi:hypothetical protein